MQNPIITQKDKTALGPVPHVNKQPEFTTKLGPVDSTYEPKPLVPSVALGTVPTPKKFELHITGLGKVTVPEKKVIPGPEASIYSPHG